MKKIVPIGDVKPNLHNPRTIKDAKFHELVRSLKNFPEMADVREVVVNTEMVILGGNMRYRAMVDAGWKEVPVKIVDWSEEKQREFIIKDNIESGEWAWEILANEWDEEQLKEWGVLENTFSEKTNVDEMWHDMPDYGEVDGIKPYRSLIMHFETQTNLEDFLSLIQQTVTDKTKYLWYPYKEKKDIKNIEIVVEDES